MNGIEAVYSETTTNHGARGTKILIILCIIPNYKEHGSYFKCMSFYKEGLEYKHTKRLIQAYCTKYSNISTPSLISACLFTDILEICTKITIVYYRQWINSFNI